MILLHDFTNLPDIAEIDAPRYSRLYYFYINVKQEQSQNQISQRKHSMTKRLRGVNFGGWLSQIDAIKEKNPDAFLSIDNHIGAFIDKNDFEQMKSWGFNHVRIPIDAYVFFDENEKPYESRFVYLDNAVKYASELGLLLVLDLHECPGHDFSDISEPVQKLFADPVYLNKTERIWSYIAERYGENSHLIFEVLNEPVAPNAQIWNDTKERLCKAVRKLAPHTSIITGSNMWNWPSTYKDMTPVDLDQMIYCFHFYEPLLFTHQFAPWMNEPEIKHARLYPDDYGYGFTRKYGLVHSDGIWNRSRFIHELENVIEFGRKYQASIVCNEFGVYAPVPMEYQLLWMDDLLSVLKEKGIGFSYWNYKNLDFGIISKGEPLHEKLKQYDNPQRINYDILKILQKY